MDDTTNYWIAPHYRQGHFLGELSPFDKIDLFEDSIRGWHLNPAARLAAADSQAGFAVLSIVLPYFETLSKYRGDLKADASPAEHFANGFDRAMSSYFVDPATLEEASELIWKQARNGLHHATAVGGQISLEPSNPDGKVMRFQDGILVLNAGALVRVLQEDVSTYIRELRDPAKGALRRKFGERFDDRPS